MVRVMVFNTILNNISVILWRSVLLVEPMIAHIVVYPTTIRSRPRWPRMQCMIKEIYGTNKMKSNDKNTLVIHSQALMEKEMYFDTLSI